MNEEQRQKPDGIDVRLGIEREPAHEARRHVAHGNGDACVGILVHDHGNQNSRDTRDEPHQIRTKHIPPPVSVSLCRTPS